LVLSVGMDQGSATYDIVAMDDSNTPHIILEKSFSTKFIRERPEATIEALSTIKDTIDSIVLPSGFGTKLKSVKDVNESDLFEISLKKSGTASSLAKVIDVFKTRGMNAFVIPSVKHLPTVPKHRKLNRIDLGTSDKVCAAALGIYTQCAARNISPRETEFVLIELGSFFNALVAIKHGQIVDGVGGTNSWLGMNSRGSLDGEVAALLGSVSKTDVYSGGALFLASSGNGNSTPEELAAYAENGIEKATLVTEAYVEGIIRDLSGLVAVSKLKPMDVYLSGRIAKIPFFFQKISDSLSERYHVSRLETFGALAKEGALGAAIIANGLAGGKFAGLVDNMMIQKASGSILENVCL
jgi:predicted butyrate kinase (DUF1464 family)